MNHKMPKIYLAADNCFLSKRHTNPRDWLRLYSELGIYYAEASADNECDPLYSTPEYTEKWLLEVKAASNEYGVKIANLYSGHGTYATLGLCHTDQSVREHMLCNWLYKMVDKAECLDSGLGFFCHAFDHTVLQSAELYADKVTELTEMLSRLCVYAKEKQFGYLGLEQMYSPHSYPYTVSGTKKLLSDVYNKSGFPLYITIDTGHQSGQIKFLLPDRAALSRYADHYNKTGDTSYINKIWVGTDRAHHLLVQAANCKNDQVKEALLDEVYSDIYKNKHLFTSPCDGDTYRWLSELGCFSPIIHLQQTDGSKSSHQSFTVDNNRNGMIEGKKCLQAIYESYKQQTGLDMPPVCDKIYLTLELFSGTAQLMSEIFDEVRQSAEYWRRFIPYDGIELDRLI